MASPAEWHGRLPWLEPGSLSEAQRDTYDRIVRSRSRMTSRSSAVTDERGRLHGPFNAMLFSPAVGTALQEVGIALRSRGVLPARLRETAILEVARIRGCAFEWYSHEPLAKEAGLSDDEVQAVRSGIYTPTLLSAERLVRALIETLLIKRDLPDAEIDAATAELGEDGLGELITLIGYYDLLALSLRVWRTPMPDSASGWEVAADADGTVLPAESD